MSNEADALRRFLNHTTSSRDSNFLKDWKKRRPPKINTFMHTGLLPLPVWRHGWHRYFVKDEATHVWSSQLVCHEEEAILKRQYRYDEDTDVRELPPVACPFCKMIECIRTLINENKVGWTQEIFKFQGDFAKETAIIHAGGFIGEFQGDKLEDSEKEALAKAGIKQSEAFKENSRARAAYLFLVVDADAVADGLQKTFETSSLGDKVKDVIADELESKGDEKGDPRTYPYCIQWEYVENAKSFNDKYKARRIERYPLTPEIESIIRSKVPDVSEDTTPFKIKDLRLSMEKACYPEVAKLIPWEEIFTSPKKEQPKSERTPEVSTTTSAPVQSGSQPASNPEAELVECDGMQQPGKGCGKGIKETDHTCPYCGFVYDQEAADKEKAAKAAAPPAQTRARRRTRSQGTSEPTASNGDKQDSDPF